MNCEAETDNFLFLHAYTVQLIFFFKQIYLHSFHENLLYNLGWVNFY